MLLCVLTKLAIIATLIRNGLSSVSVDFMSVNVNRKRVISVVGDFWMNH